MFYIFSREVKRGVLKTTDFATTVKIQEKIDTSSRLRLASIVGDVMEGSTFFASPEVSVVAVLLLTAFAVVDIKRKKFRLSGLIIPILFGLLILGEIYGKNVVHHPSPPFFMIKNPTTIFPKYYINDQYSYPSGHAARSIFLGLVFLSLVFQHVPQWIQSKKRVALLGVLVGFYILIVSVSRIYLGHHWLSDIIGGGLLGASMGLLTMAIISPIIGRTMSD
jgi:membrane-associated phospholipid phosphatase